MDVLEHVRQRNRVKGPDIGVQRLERPFDRLDPSLAATLDRAWIGVDPEAPPPCALHPLEEGAVSAADVEHGGRIAPPHEVPNLSIDARAPHRKERYDEPAEGEGRLEPSPVARVEVTVRQRAARRAEGDLAEEAVLVREVLPVSESDRLARGPRVEVRRAAIPAQVHLPRAGRRLEVPISQVSVEKLAAALATNRALRLTLESVLGPEPGHGRSR